MRNLDLAAIKDFEVEVVEDEVKPKVKLKLHYYCC